VGQRSNGKLNSSVWGPCLMVQVVFKYGILVEWNKDFFSLGAGGM